MKVSREQVAENRQSILEAASRLFRERGFAEVKVADVMQAAGLTHGGFYGYFDSKDDLIAKTLTDVLSEVDERANDPLEYVKEYLAPAHRDDWAGGCPTAGLAGDTIRQSPQARSAMTEGQRRILNQLGSGFGHMTQAKARRAAIGTWAAMIGATILARVSDDPKLSDEILKQTCAWIREQSDTKP